MATLVPKLTTTPSAPPTYNVGMAETFSWIPVEGAGRPLFARASYIANFDDFTVSISAAELNISSIELKDGNSNRVADVEDAGGGLNALRVLTQDLESSNDNVTIGDPFGNFAAVDNNLSALRVLETNPVTAVSITNQLTGVTVLNQITSVEILNTVAISGSVTITNLISSVSLVNPVTSVNISNTAAISGSVTITNPTTALDVLNTVAISGSVTINNPISSISLIDPISAFTVLNPISSVEVVNVVAVSGSVTVNNPVTAVSITNQITSVEVTGSVTITEPITAHVILDEPAALKDLNNNNVTVNASTSSLNVNVTNSIPVSFAGGSTNTDAFGRLRVSNPLTLFDSSHRYQDNNLWVSLTAVDGTVSFNQNQGLVDLTVSSLSGSSVIRETTKVFSYQPGKGMLIMSTFIMAPSAQSLRQRVGYFGENNGIYFQLNNAALSFVERSIVTGSVTNIVVQRSDWNGDKLDGTGSSGLVLDITKAQIMWMDIEWLGVGTVRAGFVINGQFIVCHSFHHANLINSTYITTASLPLRYEITNRGATSSSNTLKQVCSTAISEGGYELRGTQQAVSIPITAPRTFAATNTYYPIISIRLKTIPDRLDAIVIPTALSLLGVGNGINYNWQLRFNGTTNEGTWTSAGDNSSVEYNISGTSYTGGRVLASGYLNSSNQASPNLDVLKEALFKFQLERNGLTKTPYELTLVAATDTSNGSGVFASMDWEEISR